jgi:hypothetical protein
VRAINLQPIEMTEKEQRYLITIDCRAAQAPEIRSRLAEDVAAVPELHFSEVDSTYVEETGRVEVTAAGKGFICPAPCGPEAGLRLGRSRHFRAPLADPARQPFQGLAGAVPP